jgi:hypothetical protein
MRRPCSPLHVGSNRLAALFASLLILTATSLAQTPTAVVTGTVLDTTGGAVPEAAVTVVNQATNVRS